MDAYAPGSCQQSIAAELESRIPARFKTMSVPDPQHSGIANAGGGSHAPRTPVRCIDRLLFPRSTDDFGNGLFTDRRSSAGPRRVLLQSRKALEEKTLPPPGCLGQRDGKRGGDIDIAFPFGCEQHNSRSLGQPNRGSTPMGPSLQRSSLFGGQRNFGGNTHRQPDPSGNGRRRFHIRYYLGSTRLA